jgi:hypothetical protein
MFGPSSLNIITNILLKSQGYDVLQGIRLIAASDLMLKNHGIVLLIDWFLVYVLTVFHLDWL